MANIVRDRRGQSLIEVLIGLVIGALMIGAVAAIIAPVLRIDTQTSRAQVAAALGKELLDNVQVWSEANWHNIDGLLVTTTTLNAYYFSATNPSFVSSTGSESITVGSSTYARYFYLSAVFRDDEGKISAAGGYFDPSTKLVTVVYSWQPANSTSSLSKYLFRSKNNFLLQTNWTRGGQAGPFITPNNSFYATSGVDVTSSTGSIILQGF